VPHRTRHPIGLRVCKRLLRSTMDLSVHCQRPIRGRVAPTSRTRSRMGRALSVAKVCRPFSAGRRVELGQPASRAPRVSSSDIIDHWPKDRSRDCAQIIGIMNQRIATNQTLETKFSWTPPRARPVTLVNAQGPREPATDCRATGASDGAAAISSVRFHIRALTHCALNSS